ncbi:MAG: carbon starvation protein A [Candidatus Hydrogenedentes bacterium]|nr:carbon starvation protein A [Candidatus Hydrogenedentota bacterium]
MSTAVVAVLSFVGFIVAYNTYGRYLARKIFDLDPNAEVPSRQLNDGVDFVPTQRSVVFGHHFTSIAGTGPIVGPAIAVFWGWLPALLWVLVGSIFIGAVHDFGSLVVSMRSRGQTIGNVAARMISKRARILFLLVLFFALTVVLAIFGLVIAAIFSVYPESVLSVWIAMPLAVLVGFWIYRRGGGLLWPSLFALVVLYGAVVIGVEYLPITFGENVPLFGDPNAGFVGAMKSSVVIWTAVLLVYCFFASVLPVWVLLQPRDYINSHQLLVALVLLVGGLFVAHPALVAPAISSDVPADAPPIMPFLFITIACGAVSGFHCLVSSGTTSKQIKNETDAQYIGYGAMLMEGVLAVLVILACCAGLGMGIEKDGAALAGYDAWHGYYGTSWKGMSLAQNVGAFVEGGANMIAALGIPRDVCIGIIAVMVACFAATTLDTATRLQRYVIQELGGALRITPLTNKYVATTIAVVTGGIIAMIPGPKGVPGTGGLLLWPLFGATNQLLAGLAFLVIAFYLIRHNKPVWFLALPAVLMLVLPAWALSIQIKEFYDAGNWLLFAVGLFVEALQVWMIAEGVIMWRKAKGVLPEPLPPLEPVAVTDAQT